jgi:hypothetical protein
MILVRTRPSIFLPTIMAAWGALSVGVYGIHNFGGMVAFRYVSWSCCPVSTSTDGNTFAMPRQTRADV